MNEKIIIPDKAVAIKNLSFENYLAQQHISNSDIKHINKSMQHYYANNIKIQKPTAAMQRGTIIHNMLLTPDVLDFVIEEELDPNRRTKAYKEWKAEQGDNLIITMHDHQTYKRLTNKVKAYDPIKHLFIEDVLKEISLFFTLRNVKCRSRIDILDKKNLIAYDVKTIDSADDDSIRKSINNYLYYQQAAFYLRALNMVYGFPFKFKFIFIETSQPYGIRVITLDEAYIEAGDRSINVALDYFRNSNGEPLSYPEEELEIEAPSWLL